MQCTGWAHVELDKEWRTVRFLRPGIELDLGAIAKGYAVDRTIEVLRTAGVSALVNAGASSIAATDEAITRERSVVIAIPADALSTAMFLLGVKRGSAILPQFDGCCALWIYSDINGISWLTHSWPECTSYQYQWGSNENGKA